MSWSGGFLGGAGFPEPSNFNSAAPGIYSLDAANELRRNGYWPVPETRDAYYSITELLLSASTNGSRTATIRDVSENAFDLFVSGYTRARVPGPYGKPIDAVFNGGGNAYIKTPASSNLVIGAGDFTLEAWIWPFGAGAEAQPIFDTRDNNGGNGYAFGVRSSDGYLYGASNYVFANPNYAVAWRQWNHVAWVREGGMLRAYINGRLFGLPVAHGVNYANNFLVVGSNNYSPLGAGPFMGYIADARVTIGAARYTAPALLTTGNAPTAALPATVIDDPDYSNVLLHMNFEGGAFKDISSFNRPVSSYGGTAVSTAQQRFGAASGYFDGNTGSYLSVPYSQDFDFGYDDFTIEMWLRLNNYDENRCLISNGWPTNNYGSNFLFYTAGGNLVFYADQTGTSWGIASNVPIVTSIAANQWYHVAVCRSGGIFNLFSNGTLTNSFANNFPFALTTKLPVTIGGGATGAQNVNCHIDDLRITRRVARYPRASHTPPAIPLPTVLQAGAPFAPTMLDGFYGDQSVAVSWRAAFNGGSALTGYTVEHSSDHPYAVDEYLSNVVLLLNPDETNGFADLSAASRSVVGNGGVAVTTTQGKVGSSSIEFDGSNDYLSFSDSADFDFTGDFTIESWIYLNSFSGYATLLEGRSSIAYQNFICGIQNLGGLRLDFVTDNSGQRYVGTSTTIPTGEWVHVAFVREAGVLSGFVNGVKDAATATYTGTIGAAGNMMIGRNLDGNYMHGHIDSFRVTRGIARYNANFTPQTTAFVTPNSASATWSTSAAAANTTDATVTGLTNETNYVFRLRATNALGNSAYSNTIGPFKPSAAVPLPILGANTSPTYTSYSTRQDEYYYSSTTAASLFDNNITDNTTNQWLTYSVDSGRGAGVDFNVQQKILRYRIWRNTNNQNTPTTWVLQGSNTAGDYTNLSFWSNQQNVGSWITIDTRTSVNIPVVSGSSPATQPYGEYRVASPGNYRYYRLFVTAVRADGPGTDASKVAIGELQFLAVVPLPATPTALAGFPADGGASLSWSASGPRISNYTVEWSDDGGATTLGSATASSRSYDITGLTNGTPYVFRVRTNNTTGSGAFTAWSTSVTPAAGDLIIEDNIFRFKVTAATATVKARSSSTTSYVKLETTVAGTTYTSAVVGVPYGGYPYFMMPEAQITSLPTTDEKTIRIISCEADGTPAGNLTYVSLSSYSGQSVTRVDASGCTALNGFNVAALGGPGGWYNSPQLPSTLTEVRCVGVKIAGGSYSQWGPYPPNVTEGLNVGGQQLSASALNQMYTDLLTKTISYTAAITVTGNPGTTGDDPTIATAKGYTVYGSGT